MICILNILYYHPVSEATPNSKITGAYWGGGGTLTPFHSKHQFNAGPQKKRNYLLISFGVFCYDAYFH
jgi:hypothetical protein